MNKLFTKIASLALGAAMAFGVGVAVSSKAKDVKPAHGAVGDEIKAIANITSGNSYYIKGTRTNGTVEYLTFTDSAGNSVSGTSASQTSGAVACTFTLESTSWYITTPSGLYLTPASSNGKLTLTTTKTAVTLSDGTNTIKIRGASYYLQKNKAAANFGGYNNTQNDITLIVASETGGGGGGGGGSGSSIVIDKDTLTKPGSGSGYTPYNGSRTIGATTVWSYQVMIQSNNVQFQRSNGWLTNTTSLGKITKVTLSDSSNMVIYLSATVFDTSTNSRKTSSNTATSGSTISGSYGYFCIYDTLTTGTKSLASITVEYEASFTVDFNLQGHGSAIESQSIESGGKVTQPTAPTATGWTFGGWYKEAACTNAWNFSTDTVSTSRTLYAKWTATTFNISYVLDGGSHGSTHPSSGTYDTAFSVSAPTKTGYTFTGWTVTSGLNSSTAKWGTTSSPSTAISSSSTLCVNGTNAVYFKNINAASTAVTLTANWSIITYTVGGTITNGSLSSTANVSHGSALNITINPSSGHKLPTTLTSVTMGGSAYAGYTYNSGTGAFSIASVTGNVVINATCPVDATTYTISGSITNGSLTGDTGEQVEGDDYVVQISPSALFKYPTSVTVTGAGEEDSGWEYNSSDGIVYIYGLGGNVTISATCPAASITSITVSGQKTSFTMGEDFSFGGTVKASYDDVAGTSNVPISVDQVSVDSDAFNAFAEGSYTITVALKSNQSISTSYTANVARKVIDESITWELVESDPAYFDGEYIILNTGATYYPTTSIDGSGRATNGTAPTVTNKVIDNDDVTEAMIWTIHAEGSFESDNETVYYYSIQNKADDLFMTSASTKKLSFVSSLHSEDDENYDYDVWQISYQGIYNQGLEADYYLKSNSTYGWRCYNQSTGQAPALYKKVVVETDVPSLIKLTATGPAANTKFEDDVLSTSDFEATALFDTAETDTVTPVIVSVNSGSPSSPLVAGSNTIVLSYTDPNNPSNTKTCEVIVVAAENTAQLDGIIWDKSTIEITQFDGETIVYGSLHKHFDNGATVTLDITECTVAIYTKSGLNFTKDHDVANPTSYTFDLDDDNGKYLGVTFEEYTLYSGKLSIVETINAVYGKEPVTVYTTKASAENPISIGDSVVFAYDEASMEMTSVTSGTKGVVSEFTNHPAGTYVLTVVAGSAEGTFAFKHGNQYVAFTSNAATGSNNLWLVDTVEAQSSWTVAYDGTDVIITSVYNANRTLRYNTSANQERIAGYVTTSTSFPYIQVYKGTTEYVPSGDSIANTNAVAQKVVLEYAVHFNETMSCIQNGSTANVSGKWSDLAEDFDNWFNNGDKDLTSEQVTHAFALFAGADAVEGGDTLQDMLARYEYICAKYKLDDFLADVDRPPVEQAPRVSPLAVLTESGSAVTIVVVTSMIGLSAVGGYFFLRKRKEI